MNKAEAYKIAKRIEETDPEAQEMMTKLLDHLDVAYGAITVMVLAVTKEYENPNDCPDDLLIATMAAELLIGDRLLGEASAAKFMEAMDRKN